MAMFRYTQSQIDTILDDNYGCEKQPNIIDGISLWLSPDGVYFSVPVSEEADGRFPDFILDRVIAKNGLKRTEKKLLRAVGDTSTA